MILTTHVMYKGKLKKVEDLSPTCGYKVDVECPLCKKVRNVFYSSICRAGHTMCQSCSAKQKMGKLLELGSRYGKLTVLSEGSKSGFSYCKCECGVEKDVANYELVSGGTRSCGCLRIEHIKNVANHKEGDEHWNWKGGISTTRQSVTSRKEYKVWRSEVIKRDGHRCQKCSSDKQLQAHHINNFIDYPEQRTDVANGATLCRCCHKKFHSLYGFKVTNSEYNDFIKQMQKGG